jgi:hypothetical protein
MPYLTHSVFKVPKNDDQVTWRYLTFTKFVSMIADKKLFFCNQEVLAQGDPFEGALAQPSYIHRTWKKPSDLSQKYLLRFGIGESRSKKEAMNIISKEKERRERIIANSFSIRKALYINCWHMNNNESAAMWPIYANRSEGIAIRSSLLRMKESVSAASESIYIGAISYVDYNEHEFSSENGFENCVHKRKSFEFEQEVRMVYWNKNISHLVENGETKGVREHSFVENTPVPSGTHIACNLDRLIEKVYVSPEAGDWFVRLVETTMRKFRLKQKVHRSSLADRPPR